MCGIAGIFSKKAPSEESEISLMCDRLTKRGPDAEGFYIDKKIALGHRRLSIIDLHTGDQPMHNADGSMVIVFNGEIYNYRELRNELKVEGFTFNTESDTEVVIQACKAWGIASALNRFEGMFAFALYDKIQRKLYIARDKFGEKPLYYSNNKNEIRFASELKAFSPSLKTHTIDKKALNYFLTLTYIPAPYTIYSEIRKLEAGCYIEVTEEGDFMIHRYFDLSKAIAGLVKFKDFEEAKARVKELITESVRQRMISDVPLGAFLSGGIDSSIIATVMSLLSDQPINTFTIGFKEKTYDESIRAQLVADKIKSNHTVYYLDYKDLVIHLLYHHTLWLNWPEKRLK
jgi:asparagine synthase (glutamine-hydrolysing)